jgi:hypothetical protein
MAIEPLCEDEATMEAPQSGIGVRGIGRNSRESVMGVSPLTASLVTALLLISCANVSETYGPDGSRAYSIDCSGTARTWSMCLEKAGEICTTRGYEVVSRTGDQGAVASPSFAGTVTTRGMVIKCKS